MTSSNTGKSSIREKGLRYNLLIIEFLIVVVPFLLLFYIFYRKNVFLEFSQIVLIALTLILILAGLIMIRQIFDKFSILATSIKKAEGGDKGLIDVQKDTVELQEITISFNNLMKKFEQTTGELQRRVFELFSIKELTEVVSKSLDIDDLLNVLLEKAMAVSSAQIGSVFMVESERHRFCVVATKGLESGPKKGSYININESLARLVVSGKKPLLAQDIETDPRTRKPNDPRYGPPSFLIMPIFVRENLIAVLNLSRKQTQQVFDSNDEHIVSIMISEIGFALENAQLHSQVVVQMKDLQERTVGLTNANDQLEQEVTERKRIEEELEETNRFLRNILDSSSSISIISTDLEQNVVFWNKGAENIFGYRDEEIVGRQKIDILYPDDETKRVVNEIRSSVSKNKKKINSEIREVTKDGRKLWVNLNLTPRFDERGDVVGIVGIGEDITERKQAEEAIKESEEKYRNLVERANDGIAIAQDAILQYVNPRLAQIVGYTAEHLAGSPFADYIIPEEIPKIVDRYRRRMAGEDVPPIYETALRHKDGSRIEIEVNAGIITYRGKPADLVIVRDITERKRAEEALRESEERYRNLSEQSRDAIYITTREGKLPYINHSFLDLFGYAKEKIGDLKAQEMYANPDDRSRFQQEIEKKGSIRDFEVKLRKKNGTEMDCLITATVRQADDGRILGYQGIIRDTTEHKRTDEALRESEEKYRTILESIEDGYFEVDLAGNLTFFNDSLCKISGFSRGHLMGMNNRDYTTPETAKRMYQVFKKIYRTGKPARVIDHEIITKDGRTVVLGMSASLMRDSAGEPIGFRGVVRDVTERKRAEEELRRHREQLEELVQERTADLQVANKELEREIFERKKVEYELRAAKEAAEVASHTKSDFLAGMSHELRTPLSAIIGFSEVLRDQYFGNLNEKQADYVSDILESGRHLLSLINDILDLSKVEAGKVELEPSKVNINKLLENSLIMVKEKCMKHGINLSMNIAQDLEDLEITADELRLKQVMFNLLSNAAKFTPDGGAITLEGERKGEELIISVKDSGIGIAPEDQEKIFEEFCQLKGGLAGKTPGSGLGLSLVKSHVEMHGGRISVESEGQGKGSRFSFAVPIDVRG